MADEASDYRDVLEAMSPDHRRLERWLYGQMNKGVGSTVGEAAEALKLTPGRIVELAANHFWIEAAGDRANPAAMTLDADGE